MDELLSDAAWEAVFPQFCSCPRGAGTDPYVQHCRHCLLSSAQRAASAGARAARKVGEAEVLLLKQTLGLIPGAEKIHERGLHPPRKQLIDAVVASDRRAVVAEARVAELEAALRGFNTTCVVLEGSLVCDYVPNQDGPCGVCMLFDAHNFARQIITD